jgi:hypothetical protein
MHARRAPLYGQVVTRSWRTESGDRAVPMQMQKPTRIYHTKDFAMNLSMLRTLLMHVRNLGRQLPRLGGTYVQHYRAAAMCPNAAHRASEGTQASVARHSSLIMLVLTWMHFASGGGLTSSSATSNGNEGDRNGIKVI